MFGNSKKAGQAKGLLLRPEGVIDVISVKVDSPSIESAEKDSRTSAWVLNAPLRNLDKVGNYVMLRPDRLNPLAPGSVIQENLNPVLMGQAVAKRYTEVTSTPQNKSLGSILFFDMILMFLAVIFGLATVVMLAPQVLNMIKLGGLGVTE